ncbi:MAG TPA: response regulator transcription factor [Terriglobia bacterium]|nr:response regulator transcription factor [Terriglobia bacterium]
MSLPRILLADDHPEIVRILTTLLSGTFDVVGVAEDGIAMIDAAGALNADVVVTDLSMPRLDGFRALARLKECHPRIKVIVMTAYHDPAIASLALEAGAVGFVSKHSAWVDLIPAIQAALADRTFVSPSLEK